MTTVDAPRAGRRAPGARGRGSRARARLARRLRSAASGRCSVLLDGLSIPATRASTPSTRHVPAARPPRGRGCRPLRRSGCWPSGCCEPERAAAMQRSLELLAGVDRDASRRRALARAAAGGPVAESTVERLCGGSRSRRARVPVCGLDAIAATFSGSWSEPANAIIAGDRSGRAVRRPPARHGGRGPSSSGAGGRAQASGQAGPSSTRYSTASPSHQPPARRDAAARTTTCTGRERSLTSEHHCPACHARDGIERSQLELVGASLALAPVRDRYERSHGLCVRHALQMTEEPAARAGRTATPMPAWACWLGGRGDRPQVRVGVPARGERARAGCVAARHRADRRAGVRRRPCARQPDRRGRESHAAEERA